MSFLIDTNVISEVRKPAPDPHVKSWFDNVDGTDLFLSVLVVGEIRQGIERINRKDPSRGAIYEEWIDALRSTYADRILAVTSDVAEEWGRLNSIDPIPVVDGLMAATAKVHGLRLVTRNVTDISRTGVAFLNPFEAGG